MYILGVSKYYFKANNLDNYNRYNSQTYNKRFKDNFQSHTHCHFIEENPKYAGQKMFNKPPLSIIHIEETVENGDWGFIIKKSSFY